ncbi:MAG: putative deoxyguanosinetriphosphate triphosphohydrolase [Pedosphaera sp.]|nr:putative deoxyguanosinetriphosphate triphosphohydrolase [Pedosphaera sp.]
MKFRLDWKQLLSEKRHTVETQEANSGKKLSLESQISRTAFERDYDRVIFSTPFRRLARKTQVHPFAEMDQIHNRLTHTLEVASVGRSLASAIGRIIVKRRELPPERSTEDVICIVQAACLAHDIGNPPFGHAGEYAIREWTKEHATELFGNEMTSNLHGVARDWLFFEGNAQSFRMVARADNRDQLYFRLTYASLGAMIKYPWHSKDKRVDKEKKLNVFSSEEAIFNEVVDTLGLRSPGGDVVRHPLSFLSEAADDICYRIGDFEDAVQMRILSEKEVRDIFSKIIGEDTQRPLSAMRAQAISCLTDAAIKTFEKHYDAMMLGERDWSQDLKSDFSSEMQSGLKDIKERYPYIFSHRPKVAVELGAYNVLGKILGVYAKVVRKLSDHHDYDQLSFIQRRCVDLAWGDAYARANQGKDYDWWLGRVMDFVAGMTDNYATQVSSEIEGV